MHRSLINVVCRSLLSKIWQHAVSNKKRERKRKRKKTDERFISIRVADLNLLHYCLWKMTLKEEPQIFWGKNETGASLLVLHNLNMGRPLSLLNANDRAGICTAWLGFVQFARTDICQSWYVHLVWACADGTYCKMWLLTKCSWSQNKICAVWRANVVVF